MAVPPLLESEFVKNLELPSGDVVFDKTLVEKLSNNLNAIAQTTKLWNICKRICKDFRLFILYIKPINFDIFERIAAISNMLSSF